MKVKLKSGIEIECSVDECRELGIDLGIDSKPNNQYIPKKSKPTKPEPKVAESPTGVSRKRWTKEEIRQVVKRGFKAKVNRSYDSIRRFISRGDISKKNRYYIKKYEKETGKKLKDHKDLVVPKKKVVKEKVVIIQKPKSDDNKKKKSTPKSKKSKIDNTAKSPTDKRVIRMRFVGKQTNYYQRTYRWTREKAMRQAAEDWNQKVGIGTGKGKVKQKKISDVKIMDELPIILPLDRNGMGHLEGMIKNMIGVTKRLSYFDVRNIQPMDGVEWNGKAWSNFVTDFIFKSKKVAAFFGVKNRFKTQKAHGGDILVYQ